MQPVSTEKKRLVLVPPRIPVTRRNMTACDACYQTHRKCENGDRTTTPSEGVPCKNCARRGRLCTFERLKEVGNRARKPPLPRTLPPFSSLGLLYTGFLAEPDVISKPNSDSIAKSPKPKDWGVDSRGVDWTPPPSKMSRIAADLELSGLDASIRPPFMSPSPPDNEETLSQTYRIPFSLAEDSTNLEIPEIMDETENEPVLDVSSILFNLETDMHDILPSYFSPSAIPSSCEFTAASSAEKVATAYEPITATAYEPITIAIPNCTSISPEIHDGSEAATFEVVLPTGLMGKVLCRIELVKKLLKLNPSTDVGNAFELGVGYDCIPTEANLESGIIPGNAEGLWIKLLHQPLTRNLERKLKAAMEILANELLCPIFIVVQAPDAGEDQLLLAFLPESTGEVVADPDFNPSTGYCPSCQRQSVDLVPRFTGCRGISLSDANFLCGSYCWECLTDEIRDLVPGIPDACYRCPSCDEPLPVWAVEFCCPGTDCAKLQDQYFTTEATKGGIKCNNPSCRAIVLSDDPCSACESSLFDSPTVSSASPSSNHPRTVSPSHGKGGSSGVSSFGGTSPTSTTSQSSNSPQSGSTNPNAYSPSGGGQGEGPDQPASNLGTFEEPAEHQGGRLFGAAILSDESGWKQRIFMSYGLLVRPEYEVGAAVASHVVTKFAVDNIQIRVPRATFKNEIQRPQFHIRRTIICVEPIIADHDPKPDDYRDLWHAQDPHPSRQDYRMQPGSLGSELCITGQVNIAANPGASFGVTRKSSSSRNTHPITAVINLEKSEFQETPYGGLSWEYDIRINPQSPEEFLRLDTHSGLSVIPKSSPPSSMEATVTAIFDIANTRGIGFPNFGNRSLYRGLSIGYRQCKMVLKVATPWAGDKVTPFPDPADLSGHELCVRHQFRGGCENTIKPDKAVLIGGVSPELVMEGTR